MIEGGANTQCTVFEENDHSRIDLPTRPPEFHLNDPRRGERILGRLMLVMLLGFLAGLVVLACSLVRRISHLFPLHGIDDRLLALCLTGSVAILLLPAGFMAAVLLDLFSERTQLRVWPDRIERRVRRGPWTSVQRHRLSLGTPPLLLIVPPPTSTRRKLALPLDERPAQLQLALRGTRHVLTRVNPYPAIREVAATLAAQLRRLRPLDAERIAVIDVVNPAPLNASSTEPVPEGEWRARPTPAGTKIIWYPSPFGRRRATGWLRDPSARLAIWTTALPLACAALLLKPTPALAAVAHGARIIFAAYSAFGACAVGLIAFLSLARESYTVTSDDLERLSDYRLFRRRRRWPRRSIAAIRVAWRVGSNDRLLCIVECLSPDGNARPIVSGDPLSARQLAAVLRTALAVPADAQRPDEPHDDPTLAGWHDRDDPAAPADAPYVIEPLADNGFVARKPAAGFSGKYRAFLALHGVMTAACVVTPLSLWHRLKSGDEWSAVFAVAAMTFPIWLLGIAATLYQARARYTLEARGNGLTFTRRRVLRERTYHWPRDQIASIRSEPGIPIGSPTAARLVITLNDGSRHKLAGKPGAMRHLATRLRQTLHVGRSPAVA